MAVVQWLSKEDEDEWDAFVTKHPLGLVYNLSSWKNALQSTFKHIRGRVLVLKNEDGQIQAGLSVYTVKSWILGNRLVSVPFATMCDPLISTKEEFTLLLQSLKKLSERIKCRRIEIRTRHIGNDCVPDSFDTGEKYKHHHLALSKSTDELFHSFAKKSIQQRVRKAIKEGVVVEERWDEKSLRILYDILVATRRKHLLPPIPFRFYQEVYSMLSPAHIALYIAMQKGEPVGGLLALKFKDLWTAEYSGTAHNAGHGVSPLLYWDTIKHAKHSGAAYYSLGRTSLDNKGLLDFKRRWNTIEEDLTHFCSYSENESAKANGSAEVNNPPVYETAVKLLIRYAPAKTHKLVGDFCYRHLG